MQVLFDPLQFDHEPRFFLVNGIKTENPEVAERARMLLRALQQEGHVVKISENHGLGPVAAVHSPDYLKFLKNIYRRWQHIDGGSEEVIPNIHPNLSPGGYPDSAVGQAGWHMADTACPVGPDTWKSALASANTAVDAAIHLLTEGQTVYALCRPPGHHAFSSMAGGFCYLNNTAISAQQLRNGFERVAVIDVDLHHGNGTQEIFYQRADVLTVSIHTNPVRFYPYFWGYADEHGKGLGRGRNLNFPLPRGTGDKTYLENLERAVELIKLYDPQALVVALGLDAYEGDPLGGLRITTLGFCRIGATIGRLKLPCVLVQEGGYLCDALGENLISFLDGFENA